MKDKKKDTFSLSKYIEKNVALKEYILDWHINFFYHSLTIQTSLYKSSHKGLAVPLPGLL